MGYCEEEDTPYGNAASNNGGDCSTEGEMVCSGTGFNTCDYDHNETDLENGVDPDTTLKYVYRDCPTGTACRPANGSIICDWPQN